MSTPWFDRYELDKTARPHTGTWLYQHQQRRYVAGPECRTTPADVATTIADGTDGGTLEADYWRLAARTLAANAVARARQTQADHDIRPSPDTAHALADAARANDQAKQILTEVTALANATHVREFLTAAGDDLGVLWRAAAEIAYHEYVIDYGNDGHPDNDLALPDTEQAQLAAAVEAIAQHTGLPEVFIRSELDNAAYAHGKAPATSASPTTSLHPTGAS